MSMDAGCTYFMFPPETAAATITPLSLASAADVAWVSLVVDRLDVVELSCMVTTAPTVTAPVINFYQRPTPGTATGEVLIGTLTLPIATAIGKKVKKNIRVRLNPGDQVRVNVGTAATAGAGVIAMKCYPAGAAALEADDILSA